MKKLSRIVLGLASITMLASCAKSVTPEEAVKIASDNWSVDKAKAAGYTKVHVVNKYSDSSKDEEHDASGVAMNLIIDTLVPINLVAVTGAAALECTAFKADGAAIEFTYKDKDGSYEYKVNGVGLTTYTKTTTADGWTSSTYTWSK